MFIGLYDTDNAQHKPQLDPSTTPTGEYLTQEAADAIYAKSADLDGKYAAKADLEGKASTSDLEGKANKALDNVTEIPETLLQDYAKSADLASKLIHQH